jgi:hypothetical protein
MVMARKILLIILINISLFGLSAQNREIFSEQIIIEDMQIYPLGWSPDGNFAFIQTYDIGGLCGYCPQYKFVILSTVTDEILVEIQFDALDDTGEAVIPIKTFWEHNFKESFESDIVKYGIDLSEPGVYGMLPLLFRDLIYDVEYDTVKEMKKWTHFEAGSSVEIETIKFLSMFLSTPGRGTKRVFRYTAGEYDYPLSLYTEKYIKSPFESRILLLVVERYMGAENERFRLFYVGAHLTVGY